MDNIALAAVGAVGGFLAGGFTGYELDRYVLGGDHCGCDSPGFGGFILGSIVGAIALPIALIHWFG